MTPYKAQTPADRDYEEMRRFQVLFMEADQKLHLLRDAVREVLCDDLTLLSRKRLESLLEDNK